MASKKILVTVQVSAGAAPAEVKKVEDALGKLSTAQVKVNKATEKGRKRLARQEYEWTDCDSKSSKEIRLDQHYFLVTFIC